MSKNRKRKRHGCRNFILYCLIVAAIWFIGTCTLTATEVELTSPKIKDDVTIVQITDLHGALFGDGNKYLIERIKAAEPDFILSTGDMYTAGDEEGKETAVNLLSDLARDYPVYAVSGEHDGDRDYEERLLEGNVDVLDYERRAIDIGDTKLNLYGIDNMFYSDTFDLRNEFTPDGSRYNILAAHISNFEDFADFGMDLSLCGDTHGGQVRLPYIGALYNQGVWLPEKTEGEARYTKGLYELPDSNSRLFVSSGLGTYPLKLRFLTRPEVAVIHLTGE